MSALLSIPAEILLAITDYVTYNADLWALSLTNQLLHTIVNERLYCQVSENIRLLSSGARSTAIHWAARNGKVACVRKLLEAGIPAAPSIARGWSPIYLAAEYGHADVVKLFLDWGVDPNPAIGFHTFKKFGNPLTAAAKNGHADVVEVLIEYGVDLEFPEQELNIQQPLSLATTCHHPSVVKLLLDHGCDPFTPDHGFVPPYVNAFRIAADSDLEIFQIFVERGASPASLGSNDQDDYLLRALQRDDLPLAKFLLQHGARLRLGIEEQCQVPRHPGLSEDGCYQVSRVAGKYPEEARQLLPQELVDQIAKGNYLRPILRLMAGAAAGDNEELMRRLLEIDWTTKFPRITVEKWRTHLSSCLVTAVQANSIPIVKLLLDQGADPDGVKDIDDSQWVEPGGHRCLPIGEAAERGNLEMFKLLLDRGADSFFQSDYTLFDKITSHLPLSEMQRKMVHLLLERKLISPKELKSKRYLSFAVTAGAEVFNMILEHAAIELQPGIPEHEHAMSLAVETRQVAIMERFLKAGFSPNSRGDRVAGRPMSYLALAVSRGIPAESSALTELEPAVNLLLKYGADIEWRAPRTNMTPIFRMNRFTDPSVRAQAIELFLRKGASPFSTCKCGKTLLEKAALRSDMHTMKAILNCFDEQGTPLHEVKPILQAAAAIAVNQGVVEKLWRWYWRRIYPCPQN